jgi:hypothetical protein
MFFLAFPAQCVVRCVIDQNLAFKALLDFLRLLTNKALFEFLINVHSGALRTFFTLFAHWLVRVAHFLIAHFTFAFY